MSRAVSTVLDVGVFLLLVSAAVGTVAVAHGGETPAPDAAPAANRLATTTATVEYTLATGARGPCRLSFPTTAGPAFRRSVTATPVDLLARAAVRNLSVDGRAVTATGDHFERAVRRALTDASGPRTRVAARWVPYAGAPVGGTVAAGARPPQDATVSAAVRSVALGVATGDPARAAERDGYAGVARVAARGVVRVALPAGRMRVSLRGDYPVDRLARCRYRRFAALAGADLGGVDPSSVAASNDRIADALAARFERDLRRRFDSPAAAARAVRVGRVRVVVRRWSA